MQKILLNGNLKGTNPKFLSKKLSKDASTSSKYGFPT
jgi:hypothetical protein